MEMQQQARIDKLNSRPVRPVIEVGLQTDSAEGLMDTQVVALRREIVCRNGEKVLPELYHTLLSSTS